MITVADKANLGFLEDALMALDDGRYAEAIVTYEVEGTPVRGVLGHLWRAEVALYLDRLDAAEEDAEAVAAEVDEFLPDAGSWGVVARRRLLISAEIAHFRGDLGRARELASKAARLALLVDDIGCQIRAFTDLGRISRNRGEYAAALAHLASVSDMAREHGTPFARGLIKYYEGTALMHVGRIEDACTSLDAALALLQESENLRFTGMTLGVLGSSLCDLDRSTEGVAMLEKAEKIAADLGIARDMMPVSNNLARALLVLGKCDEAERRLRDLIAWERATGDANTEVMALKLLAVCLIEQRKLDEARRTAEEMARLAEAQNATAWVLDSRVLIARITARQRNPEGVATLRQLLPEVDEAGNAFQQVEVRVYLAEALVETSTIEAKAILAEVESSPVFTTLGWLRPIYERVARDLERVPVRVDGQTLVIDCRLGFPSLRDAREAVERFLYDRSMEQSGGNASAAGRLIGASPFQMHCLGRALQGLPTRPGRNPNPDAPVSRRRPRKLHWK